MKVHLNVTCPCGFKFGTDVVANVPETEANEIATQIEQNGLEGIELIFDAAMKHIKHEKGSIA